MWLPLWLSQFECESGFPFHLSFKEVQCLIDLFIRNDIWKSDGDPCFDQLATASRHKSNCRTPCSNSRQVDIYFHAMISPGRGFLTLHHHFPSTKTLPYLYGWDSRNKWTQILYIWCGNQEMITLLGFPWLLWDHLSHTSLRSYTEKHNPEKKNHVTNFTREIQTMSFRCTRPSFWIANEMP